MNMIRTFGIGILCVAAGIAANVHAQDITFQATVDKTQMYFEDGLILSFALSGSNIDLNISPELPDLKDNFDILRGPSRSTSISIINGRQSSSLSIQYVLSPKKTGTLEIGPATLTYAKKTYTTQPITIEVLKTAQPQTPASPSQGSPSQQPSKTAQEPEVFIRVEVDKETAYIGEQMTISYFLYTQVNISGYDITQQPNFTGFWVEELQIPQPPKLQYKTINGQRYGIALMKKVAIFPASSGEVTIDPMVMTLSVRVAGRSRDPFGQFFNDPFRRPQEIIRKTQPMAVTILPLPEDNRPDIFNGDVGNFGMSVEASPKEVTQDEPVTLRIKIQGTGNIKTVKEPKIALPDAFKRYDTQITENPFTMQEPVQGEKMFETMLIPSTDGKYNIPPVQFSYFDPQRKSYQTIRSQPINVVVLPKTQQDEPLERRIATKEEIKLLGQDLRFIKTGVSLNNQGRYWYQNGWFQIAQILPILAIFLAYGYKRYKDHYISDERYVRRRRANKLSRQRLKTAYDLMKRNESKEFYAAISRIVRQYLGDKLNLPPAGIAAEEICQVLQEYGLDDETAQLLKTCLLECDFARFAPVEAGKEKMSTVIQQAERIITRVEGLKGLKAKRAALVKQVSSMLIMIPVLLLLWAEAANGNKMQVEELFQQGNTLYEQGNYWEAIASYQAIIDSGIENGYVYYNLGNTLLKERRIGAAILLFERAKRLLPRDEDVAFNLDYARALTLDKMEPETGKFTKMLSSIRDYFTLNEVSLFFGIVYLMLTALVMMIIFASRQRRQQLLYFSIFPAILLLGSGILLFIQISHASVAEAIIMATAIEAKTGPGEAYSTVFEIHEGAKVRIQREKLDWVEIKLPNQVIGWVLKRDLERIVHFSTS